MHQNSLNAEVNLDYQTSECLLKKQQKKPKQKKQTYIHFGEHQMGKDNIQSHTVYC